MRTKEIIFDRKANTGLKLYLHEELSESQRIEQRPFILVIPGGGYSFCSEREGEPIALSFLLKGLSCRCFTLSCRRTSSFSKSIV